MRCSIHDDRDRRGVCSCSDIVKTMRLKEEEEMTEHAETKEMALQYRDRAWSEVEFDFSWGDADDFSEAARKNGWICMKVFGDPEGMGVDIYARRHSPKNAPGQPLFLAEFNTAYECKSIVLPRWQDLIDFLAHVSSTMLVAVLPWDARTLLEGLCETQPSRVARRKIDDARLREFVRADVAAAKKRADANADEKE